ncbi:MAG: lysine--tRNA ligase [Flavobacteriales bacterium]|nr:lysine--tRNA ligase [Flavobacteriales bacterium]
MEKYTEQEKIRRQSLQELRSLGINPYPADEYKTNSNSQEIKEKYEEGKKVTIAGRIMSRRIMGKASFFEIKDMRGKIQIYLNRDELCPDDDKTLYNKVFKKHLDIGDIVGVEGGVFKTKVGEISVNAKKIKLLSKAIKPIPVVKTDLDGNTFDVFKNTELRYRQRELDLIVNEGSWQTFKRRTKIYNSIRSQLNKKNFLEVETPILQPVAGGAAARPFVTHHNSLDIPLYLRIANELYLKRLIVGGEEGVYEFAKDFRNEGMDKTHNPEFTMLELYVAYKDYNWMMEFVETLFKNILIDVCKTTKTIFNGKEINFQGPYKKIPFFEAIKKETGVDFLCKNEEEILSFCKSKNIETNKTMGRGKLLDSIFGHYCEKKLIQPTFITDYPKEMSPLTKSHRKTPGLTERFELFVDGKEIANAYSEQNDPIEQRKSFEEQAKLAEKGDDEAMLIDESFLTSLEYAMPPTSGIGIGIDRLTMLLTNSTSIQDVLFFPQMKPEKQ